jgi:hypothetical protein
MDVMKKWQANVRPFDKSRNLRPRHDEVASSRLAGSRRMTGLRVTTGGI